jgi:hypothetical protein
MTRVFFSSFLLSLSLSFSSPAEATLVVTRTLEQLAAKSYVVVWGVVDRVDVDAQNGRRRAVVVSTENYLRSGGSSAQKEFFVRLEGRMMPGPKKIAEKVVGAPQLDVRDEVLVFLSPERKTAVEGISGSTLFVPTGFHQGVYRIFRDKLGGRRALSYRDFSAAGDSKKFQVSEEKLGAAPLLSDLLSRIRDAQARSGQEEKK